MGNYATGNLFNFNLEVMFFLILRIEFDISTYVHVASGKSLPAVEFLPSTPPSYVTRTVRTKDLSKNGEKKKDR